MKRGVKKSGSPKKESQPVQRQSRPKKVATDIAVSAQPVALLADVRELIQQARAGVARAIDSGLVALHWHVGRRIRQDILKEKRAEYGQKIVSALGTQLSVDFGRGFDEKSLRHMVRFAEVFPDEQIVSALRRQLSWTHFKRIIYIDDPLKRDFYAENVPTGELEHADTRPEDSVHALRADRNFKKAG